MGNAIRFALAGLLLTSASATTTANATEATRPGASTTATAVGTDAPVQLTAESFRCIRDMTPVRGFFVDNLLGHLDATLAVASSPTGGTYPPGSVVQLFPNEVMVKRESSFSPVTHDWEFFELDALTPL